MYKALLLDLDNTLLDIDFDGFLQEYMQRISARFADTVRPEDFQRQLLASTKAMVENDDSQRTVLQAFMDDFLPALGLSESAVDVFMDFYANEYRELRHWARPMPHARELVEDAFNQGLVVVIATAPLFPIEAIRERLRWAEVDDFPYHFITSADTMSFSKPYPRYYAEIADRISVAPSECLMIGDEALMDGPATQVGMGVALVGPKRLSSTVRWLSGTISDVDKEKHPRHASIVGLLDALRSDAVL